MLCFDFGEEFGREIRGWIDAVVIDERAGKVHEREGLAGMVGVVVGIFRI